MAPVTAIVGYDGRFYDRLPKLFPRGDDAKDELEQEYFPDSHVKC